MKKTDIAMIVLIAAIGVVAAFFGTRALFSQITTEEVKVPTIEAISPSFDEPDPAVFNSNAINPTVEVQVTPNGN